MSFSFGKKSGRVIDRGQFKRVLNVVQSMPRRVVKNRTFVHFWNRYHLLTLTSNRKGESRQLSIGERQIYCSISPQPSFRFRKCRYISRRGTQASIICWYWMISMRKKRTKMKGLTRYQRWSHRVFGIVEHCGGHQGTHTWGFALCIATWLYLPIAPSKPYFSAFSFTSATRFPVSLSIERIGNCYLFVFTFSNISLHCPYTRVLALWTSEAYSLLSTKCWRWSFGRFDF